MQRFGSTKYPFGGTMKREDPVLPARFRHEPSLDPFVGHKESKRLPWSRCLLISLKLSLTHTVHWKSEEQIYTPSGYCSSVGLYLAAVGTATYHIYVGVLSQLAPFESRYRIDSIKNDMTLVLSFLSTIYAGCCLWTTFTLRAHRSDLAYTLNELQQLWIKCNQPTANEGSVACLVNFLQIIQMPLLLKICSLSSWLFYSLFVFYVGQSMFADLLILRILPIALCWIFFTLRTLPSVSFLFMAFVYSMLVNCGKHFTYDNVSMSKELANQIQVFVSRSSRIVTSFQRFCSQLAFTSALQIGSDLLIFVYWLTVEREDTEYLGSYALAAFATYSAALLSGLLACWSFCNKISRLKSLLPQVCATLRLNEQEIAQLKTDLKIVLQPPTAFGFFELTPAFYGTVVSFLAAYTMIFIQFWTIIDQQKITSI